MKKYIFAFVLMAFYITLNCLEEQKLLVEFAENNDTYTSYQLCEDTLNTYLIVQTHEADTLYLFISQEEDEVRGYQANNKIILALDKQKEIKDSYLFRSKDTPSFVKRIKRSNYMKQFENWNSQSNIRAVTGATISCNSIQATVANMLKRIRNPN